MTTKKAARRFDRCRPLRAQSHRIELEIHEGEDDLRDPMTPRDNRRPIHDHVRQLRRLLLQLMRALQTCEALPAPIEE